MLWPSLKRMLLRRKFPRTNLTGIFLDSLRYSLAKLVISFDEPRREVVEQSQHIIGNQNLAVTGGRCADANRRDIDQRGQFAGQRFNRSLDDGGKST